MTSPPPIMPLTCPCRWMADGDGIESGPDRQPHREYQGAESAGLDGRGYGMGPASG
jgi:hypothetical protein